MSLQKNFAEAAASYDSAAVLAREVGQRMADRLACVRLSPMRIADVGCATGDGITLLQSRFPSALPLAVDFARPMLQAVRARSHWFDRWRGRGPRLLNADVRALPLASDSIDLVWSNLMLHWLAEPTALRQAISELHRVLTDGGLLHFAMLGPDTLKELRSAAQNVGAEATLPTFPDMHDVGDLLLASGFSDPVMEMEMLTLTYRSPRKFLADQRHLGVRDALLGKQSWRQWRRLFAAWPRQAEWFPASFEIIYGHAWKLGPRTTADSPAIMHFHLRQS